MSPAATRHQRGISLQEAALQLDTSERTVRRMLQEGTLNGFKQKATHGYVWRVVLERDQESETSPEARQDGAQAGTSPAAPELMKTLEMLDEERRILAEERRKVDELQAKLLEASNAAAHWQARAVAAEQTVQRLLPAPKDEPAEETPAEQPRRSWWQRLIGG